MASKNDVHAISVILYFDSVTFSSVLQLCRITKFLGQKCRIAWIEHMPEKDVITGHESKNHIHVLIIYDHGHFSIEKFKRDYQISSSCVEEIYDTNEYIRYLLHRTSDSCNKIQYDLSAFHANFDVSKSFNSLIDSATPEGYAVMEIIEWGCKNNATYRQIGLHVLNMGYPWKVFRGNSNYIMRCVDEERGKFNAIPIFEQKKRTL